jgi:hypothetical protein
VACMLHHRALGLLVQQSPDIVQMFLLLVMQIVVLQR